MRNSPAMHLRVLLFSLAVVAGSGRGPAEEFSQADALREMGLRILREAPGDSQALLRAARPLALAANLYGIQASEELGAQMRACLYYCRKKINPQQLEKYRLQGGETAEQVVRQMQQALEAKLTEADAQKSFERAGALLQAEPTQTVLAGVLFYEIADRFKDTELGRQAQERSTALLQAPRNAVSIAPSPAPARLPPPEPARQREEESAIQAAYKDLYAKNTPTERQALIKTLLGRGTGKLDGPEARYVLLKEARELSVRAGEVELALQAVSAMAAGFEVDGEGERSAVLSRLQRSVATPQAARALADALLKLAEEALAGERHEEAQRFSGRVEPPALQTGDAPFVERAREQVRRITDLCQEAAPIRRSFAALAADPADPEANTAVGRYYCLVADNWAKGLPRLAKGEDQKLKALALKELAPPAAIADWVALGDGWAECAGGLSGRYRRSAVQRAMGYYQKASEQAAGPERAQLAAKIEACCHMLAGVMGGAVQSGNVALAGNGARATAPAAAPALIDGNVTNYDGGAGWASGRIPCEMTVTLPKLYTLCEIRILLFDRDGRSYQYTLEVSPDGQNYVMLADRSKGAWRSWQVLQFAPQLVKCIRIKGLGNTANTTFHVVEVEAYCGIQPNPPKHR